MTSLSFSPLFNPLNVQGEKTLLEYRISHENSVKEISVYLKVSNLCLA